MEEIPNDVRMLDGRINIVFLVRPQKQKIFLDPACAKLFYSQTLLQRCEATDTKWNPKHHSSCLNLKTGRKNDGIISGFLLSDEAEKGERTMKRGGMVNMWNELFFLSSSLCVHANISSQGFFFQLAAFSFTTHKYIVASNLRHVITFYIVAKRK